MDLQDRLGTDDGWDAREVVLDPRRGSWTIDSHEPVHDVGVNEDRGILAETMRVRRLPPAPQR